MPCYRRFCQLEAKGDEKIIELEGDTDGGWVDTHPDGPGQDHTSRSASEMETEPTVVVSSDFYRLVLEFS